MIEKVVLNIHQKQIREMQPHIFIPRVLIQMVFLKVKLLNVQLGLEKQKQVMQLLIYIVLV